jgi:hypothetical protein
MLDATPFMMDITRRRVCDDGTIKPFLSICHEWASVSKCSVEVLVTLLAAPLAPNIDEVNLPFQARRDK